VQSLRLPPPVTGPLINLVLILATAMAGTAAGAWIGLLSPLSALLLGVLPAVLAPAVPFIMAGNAVYCLSFGLFKDRVKGGSFFGIVLGALLKYAVIAGAARFLLTLPAPVTEVLLLPQLVNALIGGFAALSTVYYLRRALPPLYRK
jgi:riboflavin transporter